MKLGKTKIIQFTYVTLIPRMRENAKLFIDVLS